MTPRTRSALRQRLRDLHRRLGDVLDTIDTTHATFAGVVYQLKTRCGKPQCRCREGERHTAWCVSYAVDGKRRLRTLPPETVEQLQALADRYRKLRQGRARLTQTFRELAKTFDRLERSLRVPARRALAPRGRGEA